MPSQVTAKSTVPTTTPPTTPTTPPTPPSTTTPNPFLFKRKPFVVCHLESPKYFSYGTARTEVINQMVPSPMLCDYILLDLPLLPNGTYAQDSYAFLSNGSAGHRFLFHIDIQPPNVGSFLHLLNSPNFVSNAANIQRVLTPNKLHGFGTLYGRQVLENPAGLQVTSAYLDRIYGRFSDVLRLSGTDQNEIKNFITLKPGNGVDQRIFVQHLTMLNSVRGLALVMILTVTDEDLLSVYPSSAWNETCLPQLNQPTMYGAVSALLQVANPNVNFTLALSLRLDVFNKVDFLALLAPTLPEIPCTLHQTLWFYKACKRHLFQHDPTGALIHYIGGDACAFAISHEKTSSVISFETPATVRHKMVHTYRTIGYDRTDTYIVGWLVYNVTYGLAPEKCDGKYNRIEAIRKVIDDNK